MYLHSGLLLVIGYFYIVTTFNLIGVLLLSTKSTFPITLHFSQHSLTVDAFVISLCLYLYTPKTKQVQQRSGAP